MKQLNALWLMLLLGFTASAQLTPFEKDSTRTASYAETNQFYQALAKKYAAKGVKYQSIGKSDGGLDIYCLSVVSKAGNPAVLINNAIHPGEPEGVDASMMLMREILSDPSWAGFLKEYNLYVIAQYNVDGVIRKAPTYRVNQNGPENPGFRGTAKNLDLNRDLVKTDSRNTRAFVSLFQKVKPVILIDNHTSNGADYQYTLTWFATHPAKLAPELVPGLEMLKKEIGIGLEQRGWINCPYVETRKVIPDSGLVAFFETGRYVTGYAAMHHCLGFTVETHMLKSFPQRVKATGVFMRTLFNKISTLPKVNGGNLLIAARESAIRKDRERTSMEIDWKTDYSRWETIDFYGYQAGYIKSEVTGLPHLHYDRSKPFKKPISYYSFTEAVQETAIPRFWIIPQAWTDVTDRLLLNGIQMTALKKDTVMRVLGNYISWFEDPDLPFEGHYLHSKTKLSPDSVLFLQFRKGDWLIDAKQAGRRFLAQTLDPRAPDSYFNWNFFDEVLQQKEWFSDYVFDEKAAELLKENPALKQEYDKKRFSDAAFAQDHWQQLAWIFQRSKYHENSHRLYPVFRVY